MNNKSCALFRAANLEILDYPFYAAVRSALNICDEAVIVVSDSYDGTTAKMEQLAAEYRPRVKVVRDTFVYDRGWQERWWNTAASATGADWLMYIDMDEIIDPRYAPALRTLMQRPNLKLIRFPFTDFYATENFTISFERKFNTRLGRRSAGYKMINHPHGAACHMVYDGGEDAHLSKEALTVDFPILHYGWCRDAQALAMSQRKHHAWYADGDGLEDGRLPDVEPFDFELAANMEAGRVRPYEGTHPEIIRPWLDQHTAVWHELEKQVKQCA